MDRESCGIGEMDGCASGLEALKEHRTAVQNIICRRNSVLEELSSLQVELATAEGCVQNTLEEVLLNWTSKNASLRATLAETEATVMQLRQAALETKAAHDEQVERYQATINEAHATIAEREADCERMRASLFRATEEKVVMVKKFEEEIQAERSRADTAAHEAELLRESISKLTGEKFKLWSHSDQLSGAMSAVRELATAQWQEDNEVDICPGCEATFSLFLRRHHCRRCGRVFCNSCTSSRLQMAGAADPQRVCMPCYELVSSGFSGILPSEEILKSPSTKALTTEGATAPRDDGRLVAGVDGAQGWTNSFASSPDK